MKPCSNARYSCLGVMILSLLLITSGAVQATIINVPGDQDDIQSAIDAAGVFDTIMVAPGTYTGTGFVDLYGLANNGLRLMSSGGAGSTILDCDSSHSGIYVGSGDYSDSVIIDGFTIRDAVGGDYGGIHVSYASPTISNCVIEHCDNDGIHLVVGYPRVEDCVIRHCSNTGIRVESEEGSIVATIRNCSIDSCEYTGVYVRGSDAYLDINGCTFTGNHGTALEFSQYTDGTVSQCRFYDTYAGEGGQAMYITQADPTIEYCTFQDSEGDAGGVNVYNTNSIEAEVSFDSCTFQGNDGQGLYCWNSSVRLTRCVFRDNLSGWGGAGIYVGSSWLDASSCLFDGNIAAGNGGGVLVNSSSTASITGCTFVNNEATLGSAVYFAGGGEGAPKDGKGDSATLSAGTRGGGGVENCIIAFNVGLGATAVYLEPYAWIEIMCTDIYGNAGGDWVGEIAAFAEMDGNISADPLFSSAAAGDYHIRPESPCAAAATGCGRMGAFDVVSKPALLSSDPSVVITMTADGDDYPSPYPYPVYVSATDGSSIPIVASVDADWLSVNPGNAVTPAALTLSVRIDGLTPGQYFGNLSVSSADAVNSPISVPVALVLVEPDPAYTIRVEPTSLMFDATVEDLDEASYTIAVTESLARDVYFTAGRIGRWIVLNKTAGHTSDSVIVTVDTSRATSSYDIDTIVIDAPNGSNTPIYVEVTLQLSTAAPTIDSVITDNSIIDGDPIQVVTFPDDSVLITFYASDPDGVPPALSVTGLPEDASFVDYENGTGAVIWNPVTAETGSFPLTVVASDATDADTMLVTIVINRPPSFTTTCGGTVSLEEGQSWSCQIEVDDPDGNLNSISCSGQPASATFTDNGDGTADLSLTPSYVDVDETYRLVFTASDPLTSVSDTTMISVTNRQLVAETPTGPQHILITESPIHIRFNEAVQSSSLTSANVQVSSRSGDQWTISYESQLHDLLLSNGANYLSVLDTISIQLGTGILDAAGYPLDQTYSFDLYTGVSVYPGDCNNDGSVDERDILPLGLYWGDEGPPRPGVPNVTWSMAAAYLADEQSEWDPLGGVYADADGSGLVDAEDICGIADNWSQFHTALKGANTDLAASLAETDGELLETLYSAIVECPDTPGRTVLRDALESALRGNHTELLPVSVELYQNYPNPFNPTTTIRFYVPSACHARLTVYNLLGQSVATLLDGPVEGGYSEATWNGTDDTGNRTASGIYFYRLETSSESLTGRMLLLK